MGQLVLVMSSACVIAVIRLLLAGHDGKNGGPMVGNTVNNIILYYFLFCGYKQPEGLIGRVAGTCRLFMIHFH